MRADEKWVSGEWKTKAKILWFFTVGSSGYEKTKPQRWFATAHVTTIDILLVFALIDGRRWDEEEDEMVDGWLEEKNVVMANEMISIKAERDR